MTEQEKLPRLLKWAKDGYPPIDLSNEFKAVIELIKYAQQRDELIKAADEVIQASRSLKLYATHGLIAKDYNEALESYTTLKQQNEIKTSGKMKTEAEKAWEEKAAKLTEILPCSNYSCGMREYEVTEKLIELLSDFKASLREEIAKEIDAMPDFQSRDRGDDAYISGLEKAIKLLDTVKPSTSQPEGNTVNMK